MIANAWKWADQHPGRKRINPIHGEEEIKIILRETFEFMEEDGEITSQTGAFEMEDESGSLFDTALPDIAADDDIKLLDSVGGPADASNPHQAAVGGGSFKLADDLDAQVQKLSKTYESLEKEATKSDAALAVQSIPAYVELSNIFIALVSELSHKDSNLACSLGRRTQVFRALAWKEPFSPSRAVCYIPLCIPGLSFQQLIQYSEKRLWCRLLSNRADTSVIVVYSAREAEFMFPLDWQHNTIVEGNFTVESDRAAVVKLGEMAVESKIQHLREKGPLSHFRFYLALHPKLLSQPRREEGFGLFGTQRDLQGFLKHFRFESLQQAVADTSSMNAATCLEIWYVR
eukprot:s11_g4.t1